MKPYYEHGGITIYHGDCREILPEVSADALVTDPPYGINAARTRNSQKWGWTDFSVTGWDADRPSPELLMSCVGSAKAAIVWGGNYFIDILPFVNRGKWLIWDKCQTDFSLADCEMAWCSFEGAIRRFAYPRVRALKDGKQHPTQKPQQVMAWCLTQLPNWHDVKSVIDPFSGSGTTLVEAKRLGRIAIGIEIEERYCEIAAKRLAQDVLPLEMAETSR